MKKLKRDEDCPLLKKCKVASGIDCENRDYRSCNLYLNLLKERRR